MTRNYCQFLISTKINYTQTYFADHHKHFSHDSINRYLNNAAVTPGVVWDLIKGEVVTDPDAFLLFDDSVSDKNHSHKIELVRKQYSGNAHGLIKGIGVVNCLYVNPKTGQYWIIDWRVYAPEEDGKSKLQHMREMFDDAIHVKQLEFSTVLMDSWYATKELMLHIHKSNKIYYCPLKKNRHADDSDGEYDYMAVSELTWSEHELAHGRLVKLKGFPGAMKVKLFRVAVTNIRTEYVVTNDLSQSSTDDTHNFCRVRWKIEQYHREVKQELGIEKCQCRTSNAQRNHIGCVILAWHSLTAWARQQGLNIYNVSKGMLSNYMRQELDNPSVPMIFV
jgi:Transposase DDE domain